MSEIYELVNPSDAVTIEAPSDFVAGLVGVLLGEGKYGVRREDGESACPLFIFNAEAKFAQWLGEHGHAHLADALETHLPDVIAGLRSVVYGTLRARGGIVAAVQASGGDMKAALAAFNDSQRTSLNDIGGRAMALADFYESDWKPMAAKAR